jgi:hypothetical protein
MFPTAEVRPGSTWETTMTFLAELSDRTSVNVRAPITFTSYENVQTPMGENLRAAKLETRFRLPENVTKNIAMTLQKKVGTGSAGMGGGAGGGEGGGGPAAGGAPGAGGGEAGGFEMEPEDFPVARTEVSRTVWFDVVNRRVLRAQDIITTYYEYVAYQEQTDQTGGGAGVPGMGGIMPGAAPGAGVAPPTNPFGATTRANMQMGGGIGGGPFGRGGMPGIGGIGGAGEGGAAAAQLPPEPTKVNYQLTVTTWYDDEPPPPSGRFTAGGGTAHARDSVQEPPLSRVTQPSAGR